MKRILTRLVSWLAMATLGMGVSSVSGQTDDKQETGAETVYSGPQPGEALPRFEVLSALGEQAGETVNWVREDAAGPIVLVFVHQVNRQSISFARTLTQFTKQRHESGLRTGVVFLAADATAGVEQVQRIQHALTPGVNTGVSPDGLEGPGSYGLNREVMMTVLVANQNQVRANFALIQPSLAIDLPKVVQAIVDEIGGPLPDLAELQANRPMASGGASTAVDPEIMRPLLAPVIRRNATDAEIEQAALVVEQRAAEDEAIRREVGRIANTIISAGKLENYGTAKSQEFLKKWAAEYGSDKTPTKSPTPPGQPPATGRDK